MKLSVVMSFLLAMRTSTFPITFCDYSAYCPQAYHAGGRLVKRVPLRLSADVRYPARPVVSARRAMPHRNRQTVT